MFELTQFSKYILVSFLTEWLTDWDFLLLDSALCNRKQRKIVLGIIQLHSAPFQSFIFPRTSSISLSFDMFLWALSRNFDLTKISSISLSNQLLKKISYLNSINKNKLMSFAFNTKSFYIDRCFGQNSSLCSDVIQNCENVMEITLTSALACDTIVQSIATHCFILNKINLFGCNNVSEIVVIQLCRNCQLLRDLNVSFCKQLSSCFMRAVIVHCSQLSSLHFLGCDMIRRRDKYMFFVSFRGHLEEVHSMNAMNEFTIRLIVGYRGFNLRKLNLGNSELLNDAGLELVGTECSRLTELNLSGCRTITTSGMESVAPYVNKLVKLHFLYVSISDDHLIELLSNCPHLTDLWLSNNLLTQDSLVEIGAHCPHMKVLMLDSLRLTDEILTSIVLKCEHLIELDVHRNYDLTDNAFITLSLCCPKLRKLRTSNCDHVTDATLYALADNCCHLVELDVSSSVPTYSITNKGIKKLVSYCRDLQVLNVENCALVGGGAIQVIAENARNLVELHTTIKVTTTQMNTIKFMIEKLRRLRYLSLYLMIDQFMILSNYATEINCDLKISLQS